MEPSTTNLTYSYFGDLVETGIPRQITQPAVSTDFTKDSIFNYCDTILFDEWTIPNGYGTTWYVTQESVYGFKAFNSDMTCRNKQYSIGQTNIEDCMPIPCEQGMHFCTTLMDVYHYYFLEPDTKIAIVKSEPGAITVTSTFNKFCTNKLKVFRLLSGEEIVSLLYCELSYKLNSNRDIPGQIRGLCLTTVYQKLVSEFVEVKDNERK